jgi:dolichyl-phosphate-mannose-protein mannosyltransferase
LFVTIFSVDHFYRRYGQKMIFLFGAYALHYLPFFLMSRSLYLHHYLPAYMFSCMVLAAQFDSMTRNWRQWLRLAVAGAIVGGTVGAFWWLSPLVYGTVLPAEELSRLKLLKSWNF